MCIFWTGWGSYFISFKDRHCHNDCFVCSSCRGSLVGVQRHYRPWWNHFSWIFLVHSGEMISSVSVIKPLPTKEPRQDEQTKPLLCQSRPSKDMSFKPCFLTKIHTNYFRKKNWSLVFLTDNVSFAWWFCVYFLNRHWRHEVHILWRPSLAQRLLYLLILQRLFGWQRLHYRRWRHHLSWMCQEKTYGRYSWAIKSGRKSSYIPT